ncbi:peptide deformylase [Endozoicomonas arenosclerae]|uniref:peptide deformylase n=1 Tax=Endozoicomonas arenosclerae TaxID=1633495 RepID=UPI000AA0D1F0|nr:peptide deformylase [Endozoicomonas arenosclerae]
MNFRKFLVILAVILGIFAMVAYLLETAEEDVESDLGEPVTSIEVKKQVEPVTDSPPQKIVEEAAKKKAETPRRYTIFQFENPDHQSVLNSPTQPVKRLPDPEINALIKNMHAAMSTNVGGGISANQVGQPLQLFLIGPPPMINATAPSDIFINPVITQASKERSCFWHGCLSSKGKKFGKVATWNSITIEALDPQGRKFTRELKGLDAIVAQHEFRHLLGGGYHDHAQEFEDEMTLLQKMMQRKIKMIEPCDETDPFLLEDYKMGETIEQYAQRKNKTKMKERRVGLN